MKFENISTEEDLRMGQIRMVVLWEKEDVDRFSEFFKRDMVDVVHIISNEGVVGTLLSPQSPSVEASKYDHTCDGYPHSDANLECQACRIETLRREIDSRFPDNAEPLRADGSCVNCGEVGKHSVLCHWWRHHGINRVKKTNGGL